MDLTGWWAIAIGMVVVLGWIFRSPASEKPAPPHGPPVPEQVGRTRNYQGSTQDNAMHTQALRRRAVQAGSDRFGHKGSDNGSLERFFVSA